MLDLGKICISKYVGPIGFSGFWAMIDVPATCTETEFCDGRRRWKKNRSRWKIQVDPLQQIRGVQLISCGSTCNVGIYQNLRSIEWGGSQGSIQSFSNHMIAENSKNPSLGPTIFDTCHICAFWEVSRSSTRDVWTVRSNPTGVVRPKRTKTHWSRQLIKQTNGYTW